mgnify:FL=1
MIPNIISTITKNNQLRIDISNLNLEHGDFKLCFSLVYSIISIDGAEILKQVGRYYELKTKNNSLLLTLQKPRIGTYNLSCGPEGIFMITKNNKLIEVQQSSLTFENEINNSVYDKIEKVESIPVIPEPTNYSLKNEFIQLSDLNIKIDSNQLDFIKEVEVYIKSIGINFNLKQGIPLIILNSDFKSEEYKIEIFPNKIEIHHSDYSGKLYAIITLIQLINFYKNKLPLCLIQDSPSLEWRGMHLDCARQYYSLDEIKRLFHYMALFKLNRFHWHLTDNEAWRIKLDCYPLLTDSGAFRGYHQLIPPFYGSGYDKYGGYYSKEDILELIQYGKKLNIEIMPEIDLPAHSWTLLQIMPDLRDLSSNIESQDVGSYSNNTINPSVEETNLFLKNVFEELSNIFSFNVIHVGVDERPRESWTGSPKIIEFMKKNNLNTFEEVQDFYMNNIINTLKKNNKRTAAWNEAALPPYNDIGSSGSAGNIDKSCLIFAWEHPDVGIESTNRGFETIICPGKKTYFDMAYNNSTNERGICWAATIEAKEIHDWEPLQGIDDDKKKYIKGIQGQLWSETITKKEYFDIMINPRLATLAELAWRSKSFRSWKEFRSSLSNAVELLSKMGWNYHKF